MAQLQHPLAGGPAGPLVRHLQFELDTLEATSLSLQHTAGSGLDLAHRAVGLSVSATHRARSFLTSRARAAGVYSGDQEINITLLPSHPSSSYICLGLTLGSCAPAPVVLVSTEESMICLLTQAETGQRELEEQNFEEHP